MKRVEHRLRTGVSLVIFALCYLLFSTTPLRSQSQQNELDEVQKKAEGLKSLNIMQPSGVALESTVDPLKYFVGPSDGISVNIWMSPPVNFLLTVTPEGTLIIPTVAEVSVSDMTLDEAKKKIISAIRQKYKANEISVTLIQPRSIVVSVTGVVLNPGLYTFTSVDRANRVIEEANKLSRTQIQAELDVIEEDMSTRNIVLKHKNGSEDRIDLTKFFATKEDKFNPYLREGDIIIVPRKNRAKNVFGIYGEVNVPGRYELVAGDKLSDAIKIAYGFTRLARTDSAEFSRLNEDGSHLTTSIINLENVLTGMGEDILLEPGDRIIVKTKTDLREDYRVFIQGEVLYPGYYPITKNQTRLSQVIKQAGGFTEFASLKSSELIRRSVKKTELETERLLSLRGGASVEDSSDYFLETELRLKREIVNVDFEMLFAQADSAQDVILQSEDEVNIPSKRQTIYVFGQVVSPGHIPYVKGNGIQYYISKAGGYTERAREEDVKIIKSKTKQWLAPDETTIEEGDYIWIPKIPERDFAYYATVGSQVASVLSVFLGLAALIVSVSK